MTRNPFGQRTRDAGRVDNAANRERRKSDFEARECHALQCGLTLSPEQQAGAGEENDVHDGNAHDEDK